MIQTQNRNQQDDHGFVHVGRTLNYAAREISCALDAYISTRVSPELTGMRGMVLGFLMQETESGKQIYQRDLEARFHTNRSSITTMLQGMEQDGFITRSAVAKIEVGQRHIYPDEIRHIRQILSTTYEELFERQYN